MQNEIQLSSLLEQVTKERRPLVGGIFEDIEVNPSNYVLLAIKERKEYRKIGIDDIPKKGRIIGFVDNDFYSLQGPKFKTLFPELDSDKSTAIIERVENVLLKSKNEIELTIRRYVIQEKENHK